MTHLVSVFLEDLSHLTPTLEGMAVHGANLTISKIVLHFLEDPNVEALEVFLHPSALLQMDRLQAIAAAIIPPERQGKGALRFYPRHLVPEVWRDGAERMIFTVDPEWLPRDRYLRDCFAQGPTPILCDTHALGHHRLWTALARYAQAPPAAFDSISCISVACRGALRRAFDGFLMPQGRPMPCRLDVIPHGVDTDEFFPSDPAGQADARRQLGLPGAGRIALFLARLTPQDKADLQPLIRAFAQVAAPEDSLVIAGAENAPGYVSLLGQLAESLGIGGQVIFRTDIPFSVRARYFAAADLFVFPADCIQESLGNVILEAMASGLPVISSDWDGMRDLVVHGETGWLVPTYLVPGLDRIAALSPATPLITEYGLVSQAVWIDSGALADALRSLFSSPDLRRRMGEAGRKRVEERFTWPQVFQVWETLREELTALARQEPPEAGRARQDAALQWGLPTPYTDLFQGYATHVLDPARTGIRLTDLGRAVAQGQAPLQFYEQTLPLVHGPVLDALFETLVPSDAWLRLEEIAQKIATRTGWTPSDLYYHVALLLKKDLITLSFEN